MSTKLAQGAQSTPFFQLPKPVVNAAIIALGAGLSTLGYYQRKTDLGMIAMGAGSSIVGAGIVLLILDFTGQRQTDGA